MSPSDRRLLQHLVIAVAIKLLVLFALWWAFVRDERVTPDSGQVATHVMGVPAQDEKQAQP
jgi:uncharacterized membrane protein YozB (DUF420 family)